MTTTGFATTDFNLWGTLPQAILVMLMFIGACAGSTGGGMKVSRVMIYFKEVKNEISYLNGRLNECESREPKVIEKIVVKEVPVKTDDVAVATKNGEKWVVK